MKRLFTSGKFCLETTKILSLITFLFCESFITVTAQRHPVGKCLALVNFGTNLSSSMRGIGWY